ncbi:MAG: hypothetical protein C0425_01490 [Chlorobiaceae bacterium]|nr:hypothetical protein [Chlorobiaceae bacterium]MBA4308992.1 hypothetical protein [Chlorobiaceae bacterium]
MAQTKMERKKFFSTIGFSILGLFALKSFPFGKLFARNSNTKKNKITVKINPDAVSRKSTGVQNG